MQANDGHLYVVKFRNNPQHVRILANELLASCLALAVGLTVPPPEIIEVPAKLIRSTSELSIRIGDVSEPCSSGLHFASRVMGGLLPRFMVDYLPEEDLERVRNFAEFAGILAFDKWTGNVDARQAVFVSGPREHRYKAWFIDFGYCFHAGDWNFEDHPLRGLYCRKSVYRDVTGLDSFEPWLTRIETLPPDSVWEAASGIPQEWYGGDMAALEALVEKLIQRRSQIHSMIDGVRRTDGDLFPNWGKSAHARCASVWPGRAKSAVLLASG
jgi:hypothetical protein